MNTKDRKLDYSDQDIYCGIDVHKKSWKMTVSTVHTIGKTVSMERPFVENVLGYLEKNFPGGRYHAAYEAGFSGFWAQRALSKAGVDTIVVNAADIPTTNKQRRALIFLLGVTSVALWKSFTLRSNRARLQLTTQRCCWGKSRETKK